MKVGLIVDFEKAESNRQKIREMIRNLRSSGKRVFIFGGGYFGNMLKERLAIEGVDAITVIDDKYVNGSDDSAISLSESLNYKNAVYLYGIFNDGFSKRFYTNIKRLNEVIVRSHSELIIPDGYWTEMYGTIMGTIDPEFLKENYKQFEYTYNLLEDQLSRDIMTAFLYAGISHDATVLEQYWTVKEYDYDLELLFKCYQPQNGIILECGAFDGKSIVEIADHVGMNAKLTAMECDNNNYARLCKRISIYPNIKAVPMGVWNKPARLVVTMKESKSTVEEVPETYIGETVEAIDIDSLVGGEDVAVILMDIEGSEMTALEGAKRTIEKGNTSLAVRVYHKQDDLITIPQYLYSINKSFKFYLRYNHTAGLARSGSETTLYAMIDRCK